MTPTQRTLKALKELYGPWSSGIVERWIPKACVRKDLFGIIDIVVTAGDRGILGVQSTGQDFSGHHKKLTEDKREECVRWLKAGGLLELWGWRKVKVKRGGKAMVWKPRIKVYTLGDFIDPLEY
jgi:hypothetical protein